MIDLIDRIEDMLQIEFLFDARHQLNFVVHDVGGSIRENELVTRALLTRRMTVSSASSGKRGRKCGEHTYDHLQLIRIVVKTSPEEEEKEEKKEFIHR